jgi:hypothetical protein
MASMAFEVGLGKRPSAYFVDLGELFGPAGAPERDVHTGLVEEPSNSEMDYALAEFLTSVGIELVCRFEIFREVRRLEFRVGGFAHIVFAELAIRAHGAAAEAATERAIGERGFSVSDHVGQNVAFDFAFEEIVGRLNGVQREDRFEADHLFGGVIADADGADFPLFVEFAECGGGFFDGHKRIGPVNLVDVDVTCLEAVKRIVEFVKDALAGRVAFDAAGGPIDADFCGEQDVVSAPY